MLKKDGEFGLVYDQFRGKIKEAFDFLIKNQGGYLLGVFHRADIGDIDLTWGAAPTRYSGYGLFHIIHKHIDTMGDFESLEDAEVIISDVIADGILRHANNDNDLIYLEKDNYRVVIAQTGGHKWILSAFDYVKSKKEKEEERKEKRKTLPPSEPPDNQM